VSQRR